LVSLNREFVLSILFRDFERHCNGNVAVVAVLLEKAGVKAPILDFVAGAPEIRNETLERCIAVHEGAITKTDVLAPVISAPAIALKTRRALWPLLAANGISAETVIFKMDSVAQRLAGKAEVVMKSELPLRARFLTRAVLCSHPALRVAFDWMVENCREQFESEWFARLVLGSFFEVRRVQMVFRKEDEEKANVWESPVALQKMISPRKLDIGPVRRYVAFIAPKIGLEKVREFLSYSEVAVRRSMQVTADVLTDPIEKALSKEELLNLTGLCNLITDVGWHMADFGLRDIVESLTKEEIAAKLQYPDLDQLIAAARKCIDV
jgi:hypothetical protein